MISYWLKRLFRPQLIAARARLKGELLAELRHEIKADLTQQWTAELAVLKTELGRSLADQLQVGLTTTLRDVTVNQSRFLLLVDPVASPLLAQLRGLGDASARPALVDRLCDELRMGIRLAAGLTAETVQPPTMDDLMQEASFLQVHRVLLKPIFQALHAQRVLFAGQAYYNAWYLSRALRPLGWKADVLNWDGNPTSQIYYHGEDFLVGADGLRSAEECVAFYMSALYGYDVFHFSNAHGIAFGFTVQSVFAQRFGMHSEIELLKALGKKIVYTNNGCYDGVSQTAFARWGDVPVCSICRWRNEPTVCSDERNLTWGRFRNAVADYQCLLGGNRVDYNDDARVHEVPEFYCLDPEVWHPELEVPDALRLPQVSQGTVRLYHAVGHKADRTTDDGVNIKSSHVYLPLIEKLRQQGHLLEMFEPSGIPNKELRFLQVQVDIFLDMLSYGWFGANAREAMMLGKPVVCYIRPEWLESLRAELPEYAAELPIVDATPATVEAVLLDLIGNPAKRQEIGRRSRAFALKWHSAQAGGRRFDEVYRRLLAGDPLLRQIPARGVPHG